MVFQSRTYSVLIVSASELTDTLIRSLLPATDFWPVNSAYSADEAKSILAQETYDILVMDSPLSGNQVFRLAAETSAGSEISVMIIVENEHYEEMYYKALPHGIVTVTRSACSGSLDQSLRMLCAMREKLRGYVEKQDSVDTEIEEIRLMNRAKWLLIECLKLTEDEAHRYILKQAMEQRISKREASENIIRTYQ